MRLNLPQRIVIVIALAVACGAAGVYVDSLDQAATSSGWYAYAPLSSSAYAPQTGPAGWLRLVVWLALALCWALVSVWLLRPGRARQS